MARFRIVRTDKTTGPKSPIVWPLYLLFASAFVSIWGGWVGLGEMTGFGPIKPLPGIADSFTINSAVTLPLGMEAYAAYGMYAWLNAAGLARGTRRFAMWSALSALALGAAGQIAYHVMSARGIAEAPTFVTVGVATIPVIVVGFGAALTHKIRHDLLTREETPEIAPEVTVEPVAARMVVKTPEIQLAPRTALEAPQAAVGTKKTRDWTRHAKWAEGLATFTASVDSGSPLTAAKLAAELGMQNKSLALAIMKHHRTATPTAS